MKTKGLALASGILGLVTGILSIIGAWVLLFSVTSDNPVLLSIGMLFAFLGFTLKVATIILGIVGVVQYKDDTRVNPAAGVLLIIGGSLMILPFFSFIGNILLIVGGSLYLASLKNFDNQFLKSGMETF